MGNFRTLKVWQISKDLAVAIYKLTSNSPGLERDFRFREQIRTAVASISSNIAEGDEVGYISEVELKQHLDACDHI